MTGPLVKLSAYPVASNLMLWNAMRLIACRSLAHMLRNNGHWTYPVMGSQRMHSSTPFLALGCQYCHHHHTAFLALDLAEDSLHILFEVIDALAPTAMAWRGRSRVRKYPTAAVLFKLAHPYLSFCGSFALLTNVLLVT